jgi:hypothetical protein
MDWRWLATFHYIILDIGKTYNAAAAIKITSSGGSGMCGLSMILNMAKSKILITTIGILSAFNQFMMGDRDSRSNS